MDLKIASALVGDPYPGQEVMITIQGGEYRFAYEPHRLSDHYVWRMVEQDEGSIRHYFPRLGENWETTFDPSFFQIYISSDHPIAIYSPLFLRAVARGMSRNGARADATLGMVESIVIL